MEKVNNSTPCSYSGYTPNELDQDDKGSNINRMLDRLALQKKQEAQWKYNNILRVKKEKKILKHLPVNTFVFVRHWIERYQDTFSKPSTRTESYWNQNDVYKIIKVTFTKNIKLESYTPCHRFTIEHTLSSEKGTVRREDLYPITLTDEERYFKGFNEYQKVFKLD